MNDDVSHVAADVKVLAGSQITENNNCTMSRNATIVRLSLKCRTELPANVNAFLHAATSCALCDITKAHCPKRCRFSKLLFEKKYLSLAAATFRTFCPTWFRWLVALRRHWDLWRSDL